MSSLFPDPDDSIVAYCDGGSRGNPGPAGFGVYIQDSAGAVLAELSQFLGTRTNNFAEYSALLAALEFAITEGHRSLRVVSDSELMVKQMKGQYRVNSPELRPLYEEAKRRVPALQKFQIQHVLRDKNRHADRLANLAMDRGTGKAPARAAAAQATSAQPGVPDGKVTKPGPVSSALPKAPPAKLAPAAPPPAMLRGFTRQGVVHILGGELPDGIFVKVIPE